jgi:ABC-type dipeptide/oligopeptide/nickel transport system ATPase component
MWISVAVKPGEAVGLVYEYCGKSTVALGVMQDLGRMARVVAADQVQRSRFAQMSVKNCAVYSRVRYCDDLSRTHGVVEPSHEDGANNW